MRAFFLSLRGALNLEPSFVTFFPIVAVPPSDANAYFCKPYLEIERAKTARSTPGQRRGRRRRLGLPRISPKGGASRAHGSLLHPVASSSEAVNETDLRLPRGHGRNAFDGVLQHYRDARRDLRLERVALAKCLKHRMV